LGGEIVQSAEVPFVDGWHEAGVVFEGRADALVAKLLLSQFVIYDRIFEPAGFAA
jgi:hypothetical protein